MKPRRVLLSLELHTDATLDVLRAAGRRFGELVDGCAAETVTVKQVQVNSVQRKTKLGRKLRKGT